MFYPPFGRRSFASAAGFQYPVPVRMAEGRTISVVLLVTTALVLGSALFGRHGARHLGRLHTERQQVADATFALLRGNAQLREEIDRLRNDERLLEQRARRQLGLVRPGELVFRFGR